MIDEQKILRLPYLAEDQRITLWLEQLVHIKVEDLWSYARKISRPQYYHEVQQQASAEYAVLWLFGVSLGRNRPAGISRTHFHK